MSVAVFVVAFAEDPRVFRVVQTSAATTDDNIAALERVSTNGRAGAARVRFRYHRIYYGGGVKPDS